MLEQADELYLSALRCKEDRNYEQAVVDFRKVISTTALSLATGRKQRKGNQNENNLTWQIENFWSYSSENVDYPDFGHPLARAVSEGDFDLGISICGTGNGINMTVNKHQDIRSALCWNEEISRLARAHNDANICEENSNKQSNFI